MALVAALDKKYRKVNSDNVDDDVNNSERSEKMFS